MGVTVMRFIAAVLILAIALTGCVEEPFANNIVNDADNSTGSDDASADRAGDANSTETTSDDDTKQDTQESKSATESGQANDAQDTLPVKEVTEGELVSFPNLKAVDPDGDPITYAFTNPLDERGKWQTTEGDAGEYRVTITASDGTNEASQEVLLRILAANSAPTIRIPGELSFNEGETVTLEPETSDADGDDVTISYFGWMNTDTKETTYNDAGRHQVTIEASDGKTTSTKEITVVILDVNRKPVLADLEAITITEGDDVSVDPSATDPDGDSITYTYAEPLDAMGTWKTTQGDAGEYTIDVIASDGTDTVTKKVRVVVESLNKAPTIELADITVEEGETVTLNPTIMDPEDDEFTVTYSGWMTSTTKETSYDDAGVHSVTITAQDTAGNVATLDVQVTVEDVNRPPEFDMGSFN